VLKGHENPVAVVMLSPDGKRLVTHSYYGTTIIWYIYSYEELKIEANSKIN
jgi:WD40 repeat protein